MTDRLTRDLCQDDWQAAHPTEYAPVATREGECDECGDFALITRSTIADEDDGDLTRGWDINVGRSDR